MIKHYPDAALIASLISKGHIIVRDPEKAEFQPPFSLHQGENDALSLAIEIHNSLFATDDGKAIKAARFLKIPFIISPKIVIELFKLRKISFEDARESIEKLSIIGRYSPDIIANALVLLTEEKKWQSPQP
jgi:predicted nucleic acid-binding protein